MGLVYQFPFRQVNPRSLSHARRSASEAHFPCNFHSRNVNRLILIFTHAQRIAPPSQSQNSVRSGGLHRFTSRLNDEPNSIRGKANSVPQAGSGVGAETVKNLRPRRRSRANPASAQGLWLMSLHNLFAISAAVTLQC